MKFFETPAMEIVKFAVADVVTTSTEIQGPSCTSELGGDEL